MYYSLYMNVEVKFLWNILTYEETFLEIFTHVSRCMWKMTIIKHFLNTVK